MRSFTNFLLFEDTLQYIPNTAPGIYRAANLLLNPTVSIVETDCGTLTGVKEALTYNSEGLWELATNEALTRDRITHLLSQGQYTVNIRDQSTCISDGGLCQSCFNATILNRATFAQVGNKVSITNQYAYYTDLFTGPGAQFTLSKTPDLYNNIIVLQNNNIISPSFYSISGTSLTLSNSIPPNQTLVVFYLKFSDNLLLSYLAKSYSGSLIGLLPLLDTLLPIKPALYQSLLSDTMMTLMKIEISGYPNIPLSMIDYIDVITDKLEKALYIILLYVINDSGTSTGIIPTTSPINFEIAVIPTQSFLTQFFFTPGIPGGQVSTGNYPYEFTYTITSGLATSP